MTEEAHRRITTRLQIIGMVGALLGGAVALWQYIDSAHKQFQAPIWQKQVELYTAATETIARLAFTEDQKGWNEARLRFWELYGGPLILVEDDAVARRMMEFGRKVRLVGDNPKNRPSDFENDAMSLSYEFRHSIENSVGSGLPALTSAKSAR